MIFEIGKLIKEYETGSSPDNDSKDNDLYNINEIIELYPLLSKHIITNGINDGILKVTWIGNKRYFKLEDVEKFISEKQEKSNNMISSTIASWRNK
ncbi:MAG: hypothetical protein IJ068_00300 [Bacilli bacterium]|nr:hypothetical protein [Bacilli bacterium]